jgi:DNA-binding response OmpR family regulator
MASVLIVEPHPEVRELLVRIVRRLGHVALVHDGRPVGEWDRIDAVLVEPGPAGSLDTIVPLVRERGAALVCVSIYPPSADVAALEPVAYLQKPFSLVDLERALVAALVEPATAA